MKDLRVTVRRSVLRTFALGLLGLPLVFIAVEYIWGTFGFLEHLGEWSYAGKDVEAFEARDDIFVGLMALIGLSMSLFALREFIAPRRVFVADDDGIHLPLRGPMRGLDGISWYQIKELRAEESAMVLVVHGRGELPADPWNARWEDRNVLRVRANWWERRPDHVLGRMTALGFKPLGQPDAPDFLDTPDSPPAQPSDPFLPPEDDFDRALSALILDEDE